MDIQFFFHRTILHKLLQVVSKSKLLLKRKRSERHLKTKTATDALYIVNTVNNTVSNVQYSVEHHMYSRAGMYSRMASYKKHCQYRQESCAITKMTV